MLRKLCNHKLPLCSEERCVLWLAFVLLENEATAGGICMAASTRVVSKSTMTTSSKAFPHAFTAGTRNQILLFGLPDAGYGAKAYRLLHIASWRFDRSDLSAGLSIPWPSTAQYLMDLRLDTGAEQWSYVSLPSFVSGTSDWVARQVPRDLIRRYAVRYIC